MKKLPQAVKYLIWPGLILVTAGGVIGLLNGWTIVAVSFLVVGLLLLVAGVAAGDYASKRFWGRRATQAGTNATVSVLSILVILGLINFMGARYNSRTDLTEGQLLTLAPASQQIVEDLKTPTEVLIFSPTPNPQDRQLLENYRRFNADFSYRYVDPFADPQLAKQLGVKTGGEVFLRAGKGESERTTLVQTLTPEESLTETQLTNKLAQLSQKDVAVAYFLQGHGEYTIDGSKPGYFEAITQLQDQNYTVEPLNLVNTGTIPPDADVLIIAGPQKELFANEVTAIRDYLKGNGKEGGSVFILIDPQIKTGLEPLMSEWGVVAEDTLVIDTSGGGQLVGLGPAAPLVQDYGDHPITAAFEDGRSFFPVARPLQIKEVTGIEETPLLFTNPSSHAQPMTEGDLAIDPKQEPAGPFVLGVALSQPVATEKANTPATSDQATNQASNQPSSQASTAETETPTAQEAIEDALPEDELLGEQSANDKSQMDSRMVIIGNSSFATDGLFDQQLNGDVFLNAVNWLSKLDRPVLSIRPKETTNRRFEMTLTQQVFLTLLSLVIFPLAGIIGAGGLWLIRR